MCPPILLVSPHSPCVCHPLNLHSVPHLLFSSQLVMCTAPTWIKIAVSLALVGLDYWSRGRGWWDQLAGTSAYLFLWLATIGYRPCRSVCGKNLYHTCTVFNCSCSYGVFGWREDICWCPVHHCIECVTTAEHSDSED